MKRIELDKRLSVGLATVFILCVTGCNSDYNKAQKLYDKGQLYEALKLFVPLAAQNIKESAAKVAEIDERIYRDCEALYWGKDTIANSYVTEWYNGFPDDIEYPKDPKQSGIYQSVEHHRFWVPWHSRRVADMVNVLKSPDFNAANKPVGNGLVVNIESEVSENPYANACVIDDKFRNGFQLDMCDYFLALYMSLGNFISIPSRRFADPSTSGIINLKSSQRRLFFLADKIENARFVIYIKRTKHYYSEYGLSGGIKGYLTTTVILLADRKSNTVMFNDEYSASPGRYISDIGITNHLYFEKDDNRERENFLAIMKLLEPYMPNN